MDNFAVKLGDALLLAAGMFSNVGRNLALGLVIAGVIQAFGRAIGILL